MFNKQNNYFGQFFDQKLLVDCVLGLAIVVPLAFHSY